MLSETLIDNIHCCDYLELFREIPDNTVSLVLTDPPFGVEYQNNYTHEMHEVLAGDVNSFSYSDLGRQSWRVLKDNTAIFAYTGWSKYLEHFPEFSKAGFDMKEPLIVQKRPSGKTDLYGTFQTNSDWIMFGHKGRFIFQYTELVRNKYAGITPNCGRKPVAEFKRRFPSCWFSEEFPWSTENPVFQKKHDIKHPTIKTVKFMEWLILLTTKEGDIVVDPFCGTGPVAVAAKRHNRRFICSDITPKFCDYARYRLEHDL